ncbi:hypothetical protein OF83DRAFT_1168271 [Amylostereum chailletii]|nr:hypothetical protein OF83DRAFT_1168271 [Amylostereum chailletii]
MRVFTAISAFPASLKAPVRSEHTQSPRSSQRLKLNPDTPKATRLSNQANAFIVDSCSNVSPARAQAFPRSEHRQTISSARANVSGELFSELPATTTVLIRSETIPGRLSAISIVVFSKSRDHANASCFESLVGSRNANLLAQPRAWKGHSNLSRRQGQHRPLAKQALTNETLSLVACSTFMYDLFVPAHIPKLALKSRDDFDIMVDLGPTRRPLVSPSVSADESVQNMDSSFSSPSSPPYPTKPTIRIYKPSSPWRDLGPPVPCSLSKVQDSDSSSDLDCSPPSSPKHEPRYLTPTMEPMERLAARSLLLLGSPAIQSLESYPLPYESFASRARSPDDYSPGPLLPFDKQSYRPSTEELSLPTNTYQHSFAPGDYDDALLPLHRESNGPPPSYERTAAEDHAQTDSTVRVSGYDSPKPPINGYTKPAPFSNPMAINALLNPAIPASPPSPTNDPQPQKPEVNLPPRHRPLPSGGSLKSSFTQRTPSPSSSISSSPAQNPDTVQTGWCRHTCPDPGDDRGADVLLSTVDGYAFPSRAETPLPLPGSPRDPPPSTLPNPEYVTMLLPLRSGSPSRRVRRRRYHPYVREDAAFAMPLPYMPPSPSPHPPSEGVSNGEPSRLSLLPDGPRDAPVLDAQATKTSESPSTSDRQIDRVTKRRSRRHVPYARPALVPDPCSPSCSSHSDGSRFSPSPSPVETCSHNRKGKGKKRDKDKNKGKGKRNSEVDDRVGPEAYIEMTLRQRELERNDVRTKTEEDLAKLSGEKLKDAIQKACKAETSRQVRDDKRARIFVVAKALRLDLPVSEKQLEPKVFCKVVEWAHNTQALYQVATQLHDELTNSHQIHAEFRGVLEGLLQDREGLSELQVPTSESQSLAEVEDFEDSGRVADWQRSNFDDEGNEG